MQLVKKATEVVAEVINIAKTECFKAKRIAFKLGFSPN